MTVAPQPLRTDRLTLLPCDAAMLEVVMRGEPVPGYRRHPQWPGDEMRGAIPFMLARLAQAPGSTGWGPWLVAMDGEIVGDAGAHGPPDAAGTVEIGFSVAPAMRNRGVATEAVRALLAWMRADPRFGRAVARTDAGNIAAQRVLEGAGLRRDTTERDLVVFTTE